MKRTILKTLSLAAVITALGINLSASAADKQPNIVLVIMDNLGYGELGCYGGGITRGAPTPRIDKLAAEGARLLNFNVEVQCTPSRACLMRCGRTLRSCCLTDSGGLGTDATD